MLAQLIPGADWQYFVSIAVVSLYVSVTAVALSTLVSLPVALAVGFSDFPGKHVVTAGINTGMGFPSVVVGLLVLLTLSNQGPLGELGLVFTPTAMIASQFVLATPVITSISLSAIESVGQDVRDAAFTLGGTDTDIGVLVVKEARYGIVTAILAGFGRAVSEVGSILIVGGNIVLNDPTGGKTSYTRTLTTAITVEARQGHYETGLVLGAMLLVLVLGVNVLGSWVRSRSRGRGEIRR
ncbi:ABC transporter permease [Haladaptatus pallidirubidus]|uniref:ABC transporter permease n=1 Tax=Haladaptatus pallidirubidus TaxID=1008152 RepID=A0AAV3UKW5_9EURY|nr:ABC transporter permease [Haladaptatus pallidirubidus]